LSVPSHIISKLLKIFLIFLDVIFFLNGIIFIFLFILLIAFFACLTLNLPMSLGLNKVCLFKFEISILSKSTMPILPT